MPSTIAISRATFNAISKMFFTNAQVNTIVIKQDGNTITSYQPLNNNLQLKTFNHDEAAAHTAQLIQQGYFKTAVPQEDCGTQAPNHS